jgi:hypothetical protein
MKTFKTSDYLNKYFPNVVFLKQSTILLMFTDLLEKISVISIFHHNTTFELTSRDLSYHSDYEGSSINASLYAIMLG